ncbi:MAG: hypothetical protein GKR88_15455 [Flavobacteriaceae bacterium]|nr:MAG: hypothetical protein GKR88_15455 [Flavobacteriaceae bacterium]
MTTVDIFILFFIFCIIYPKYFFKFLRVANRVATPLWVWLAALGVALLKRLLAFLKHLLRWLVKTLLHLLKLLGLALERIAEAGLSLFH